MLFNAFIVLESHFLYLTKRKESFLMFTRLLRVFTGS